MYDCLEIRSVERKICFTPECLPWVIHGAHDNDPWTVPITVSSHSTYDIASSHKDTSLQRQCQGSAGIGCLALLCTPSWAYFPSTLIWCFSIIAIFLPISSRTMTERKYRQSGIRGAFSVEDQSCWAEEGAGVNYSITWWLSQELFKQAPASRGLGLITPAKVTPTTLPHCLLLWVCQAFWEIFIWRAEGRI